MSSSSNRNNRSKKAKKPLIDPEEMKPLIKKLSRSGKFANLFLKSYVSYPQTLSCAPLTKPKCSETNKKKQKKIQLRIFPMLILLQCQIHFKQKETLENHVWI